MWNSLENVFNPAAPLELVSDKRLSARWNKSVRTLQRWRAKGYGPAWMRIGGTAYYRVGDILEFESRMRRGGGAK